MKIGFAYAHIYKTMVVTTSDLQQLATELQVDSDQWNDTAIGKFFICMLTAGSCLTLVF